jgi:hypothetical protein
MNKTINFLKKPTELQDISAAKKSRRNLEIAGAITCFTGFLYSVIYTLNSAPSFLAAKIMLLFVCFSTLMLMATAIGQNLYGWAEPVCAEDNDSIDLFFDDNYQYNAFQNSVRSMGRGYIEGEKWAIESAPS